MEEQPILPVEGKWNCPRTLTVQRILIPQLTQMLLPVYSHPMQPVPQALLPLRTLYTMTVNSNLPVSVSVAAEHNPVCSGTAVTFTATPTNGGTTPSYQWMVNGINQGTNSSTYTYTPNNSDAVTCVLTSNATCATGSPATSNTVTMTVNSNLPVSVSVAAGANPVCSGTAVTFTATPANGGTSPSYQWKVNGVNQGTNSSTYTYTPSNCRCCYLYINIQFNLCHRLSCHFEHCINDSEFKSACECICCCGSKSCLFRNCCHIHCHTY